MQTTYQEEDTSTFSSDGKHYDLNKMFRAVAHQPVAFIAVDKLAWVLAHVGKHQDKARVARADLKAPLLVTFYEGEELVVDGLHRLLKAVEQHVKELPYRRLSPAQFHQAMIIPATEQWVEKPNYLHWK
jgi:hypothetical protein